MKIKERLQGEYGKDKKDKIERQKLAISNILNRNQNNIFSSYLRKFNLILDKEKDFYNISFFLGGKLAKKLQKSSSELHFDLLRSIFGKEDRITIEGVTIPMPENHSDGEIMLYEFIDILLPYLFEKNHFILDESFYCEGPYEILGKIFLEKNDVVIDCGANMGMFSALASVKNCKVFAFEPMQYIIDTYLKKTVVMNKNIEICPWALSDKEGEAFFELNINNIGASRKVKENINQNLNTQKVEITTIDKFVEKRGLHKVDFIKADIEGAERYMLLGARETIREFSPKIAICTYHLPDDPKVLREILLSIQPHYKIIEKYKKMYAYTE